MVPGNTPNINFFYFLRVTPHLIIKLKFNFLFESNCDVVGLDSHSNANCTQSKKMVHLNALKDLVKVKLETYLETYIHGNISISMEIA